MGSSFPGGVNSLAYQGVRASNPVQNIVAQRAPTVNDLNYDLGTQWTNENGQDCYVLVAFSGGQAIWQATASGEEGIDTVNADSGSATPAANEITIVGGDTVTTTGSGSTITIDATAAGYPITPYVVGSSTTAGYTTIQSALDAANAAGGGIVYVQPGTYTEDLTLYANTQVIGTIGLSLAADDSAAVIVGVHTPPTTGTFGFRNAYLQSATHIFNSAAAGSALLSLGDCTIAVTNGFTFNLPNWTGLLNVWDTNMDGGTNDGFINNTGGATITAFECGLGQGTTNTAVISGVAIIETSEINCPVNFVTGAIVDINWVEMNATHTFSNNSIGLYNACKWTTGSDAAVVMSSSGDLAISNSTVRSSNSPAIDGAGAGTVELSEVTFLGSDSSQAATLTQANTSVTQTGVFRTGTPATASSLTESTWAAVGSDANIGLTLQAKGTGGVFHTRSAAGVTIDTGSINSDNTDNASTAMVSSSVGGTSAGDAQFQALISGGQVYTFGIDNSTTNDDFVLSKNASLGTGNILTFDGSSDAATFGDAVTATTTLTATLGDITATNGDLVLSTAGNGINIAEGANGRSGVATLTAGTVTVSTTEVTANSRIYLTRQSVNSSTALGTLSVGTVTPSTSFVINSLNLSAVVETNDVSIIAWMIVEPA